MSGRPRTTSFAEGKTQPNPVMGGMKISSKQELSYPHIPTKRAPFSHNSKDYRVMKTFSFIKFPIFVWYYHSFSPGGSEKFFFHGPIHVPNESQFKNNTRRRKNLCVCLLLVVRCTFVHSLRWQAVHCFYIINVQCIHYIFNQWNDKMFLCVFSLAKLALQK